jgi:hypothetical protein
MLESPLLVITARPGIHPLGAYVASRSRLRVKNTTWARIYLYGTYVAMGWLALKLNTTNQKQPVCNLFPVACAARYLA